MKTKIIIFLVLAGIIFEIIPVQADDIDTSILRYSSSYSPVFGAFYNSQKKHVKIAGKNYLDQLFWDIEDKLKIPFQSDGIGIFGYTDHPDGSGVLGFSKVWHGVVGYSFGKNAASVWGKSTNKYGYGVFGYSHNGMGVWGQTSGEYKSGVYALTTNPLGYGLFARNTAGGLAILSKGDMVINGVLYADNIPRNLARNATIGYSGDDGVNKGINLIDGIINRKMGVWHSKPGVTTSWAYLEWNKPQSINEICIYNLTYSQNLVSKLQLILYYYGKTSPYLMDFDMPTYEYCPLRIFLTKVEGTDIKKIKVVVKGTKKNNNYSASSNVPSGPGLAEIECYYDLGKWSAGVNK